MKRFLNLFLFPVLCLYLVYISSYSLLAFGVTSTSNILSQSDTAEIEDSTKETFDEWLTKQTVTLDQNMNDKPVWTQKKVEKALERMREFKKQERTRHNYSKSKEALQEMLSSVCEVSPSTTNLPDVIQSELKNISHQYMIKYINTWLKVDGLMLWGTYRGCYRVFFENVDRLKPPIPSGTEERHLRFKIAESSPGMGSHENLTNVKMILMNKDGFELRRINIGLIKSNGWTTGDFYISEIDYQNIAKAYLITDQDR